jgi:hypothetical protein
VYALVVLGGMAANSDTKEHTGGPPPKVSHLRAELRLMARAFFPAFALTVLVFGLVYALIVAFGEAEPEAPSKAILVPVAFGYGAFVGLWPGLVVGGLRLGWTLVGGWIAVPIVLVPLSVAIALWAASGLLEGLAGDIGHAALRAGAEREWLATSVGKAAHAGPVILVILLPLLLVDLGAIALDPQVLWAMVVLLVAFAAVVALAVIPAGLVSTIVLARAYVVRLRQRIAARRAAAANAHPNGRAQEGSNLRHPA